MDDKRVMLSRSLVAVTAGLRTSNGEMISVSTLEVPRYASEQHSQLHASERECVSDWMSP